VSRVSTPAWQEALFQRRNLGVKLDLEAVRAAHLALGSPGHGVPAIHVLGTNGKGSTAAMCAHALRHGRRVGLYTSPHLHRVGERIRVDGVPIADAAVQQLVDRVLACEVPRPLTFFEILTLAAFLHFADVGVDVMVIEAGLGGRLDATRIGRYVARLFAPIDVDHTAYLGPDVAAIAGEKAAVLADPGLAFSAPQRPEAAQVLHAVAARHGVTLQFVAPLDHAPLPGEHQKINAALALAGARAIDPTITAADLEGVRWPGRAERQQLGAGAVIFDVAHNPHGITALVEHLRATPGQGRAIAFGCLADKDAPAMLAAPRQPRRAAVAHRSARRSSARGRRRPPLQRPRRSRPAPRDRRAPARRRRARRLRLAPPRRPPARRAARRRRRPAPAARPARAYARSPGPVAPVP
jgi:dihydrofolate synthase/folylpolyglutamate synthase